MSTLNRNLYEPIFKIHLHLSNVKANFSLMFVFVSFNFLAFSDVNGPLNRNLYEPIRSDVAFTPSHHCHCNKRYVDNKVGMQPILPVIVSLKRSKVSPVKVAVTVDGVVRCEQALKDEGGKTRIWPSKKFYKQRLRLKLERRKVASFVKGKEMKNTLLKKVSISIFQIYDLILLLGISS